MKIVNRYITIEFLKILFLLSASLIIVYIVVDVFENLSDLTKLHAGLFTIS